MNNKIITLYKDTYTNDHWYVSAHETMVQIISGYFQEDIVYLRTLEPDAYKKEKTRLMAVTWSGQFSERLDKNLLEYSNLICLDIDNLEVSVIEHLKSLLSADELVRYCFISPSGSGLKIVVEVNTGPENHLAAFLHLQKTFEDKYAFKVDNSGKNISRLCYVSWDDRSIINEESKVFEVDIRFGEVANKAFDNSKFQNYKDTSDSGHIFKTAIKWVERTKQYVSGQRNVYIHALACALNRCGMDIDEAEFFISSEFADMDQKEIHGCCKSAYFHNQHEHGTVQIKDTDVIEFKPPVYVAQYTDDVVKNDLMRITGMLHHYNVPRNEIVDIVGKRALYYKTKGYIDLDRTSLVMLMNDAIAMLQQNMVKHTMSNAMLYETAEDIAVELLDNDMLDGVVPTGFHWMDQAMRGGMMPGNFYGLIGVGGTYKSIVSEFWAYNCAINDMPVLYLNGEMSKQQFYERLAKMVFGIDWHTEVKAGRINKGNVLSFIESMNERTKKNIFIVNGKGFGKEKIKATIDNIEATFNKRVRLVVIDGVTQMDSLGREEIPAAIHNTAVCKEIAIETNTVIVGLMHISGENDKTFRDTGLRCRGGNKTVANMDGYFSTSLLIDPITLQQPADNDPVYYRDKFYFRLTDKRTPAGVVSTIIGGTDPNGNLNLRMMEVDPNNYEVKLKGGR